MLRRSGARSELAKDLRGSADEGSIQTSEVDAHDLRDGALARDRARERKRRSEALKRGGSGREGRVTHSPRLILNPTCFERG